METLRGRRRGRKRANARGFTLVELMVVIVIVGILTVLATPAMRNARDDRLAFDYARRMEQLIARGRARAAGRGASQLFLALPSGVRGQFYLFEALDGTPGPTGPNPISSCKVTGQWNDATTYVPGAVSNTARIIDGFNMDSPNGVNVNADIRTQFYVNDTSVVALALCVTPSGTTWLGQGGSAAAAIADMQQQITPFNTFMELRVERNVGGVSSGLIRHVLVAGGAAPRIKSE